MVPQRGERRKEKIANRKRKRKRRKETTRKRRRGEHHKIPNSLSSRALELRGLKYSGAKKKSYTGA